MKHRVPAPGTPGARDAGFTMVDLMVGALVGVILIGAVLSILVQQGRLRQSNSETTLAIHACMNTLERLRALDSSDLLAMSGTGFAVPGPDLSANGLSPVDGDPDDLPGHLIVVEDQSFGSDSLYLVQATVTWRGVSGRRTYSLNTMMGNRK